MSAKAKIKNKLAFTQNKLLDGVAKRHRLLFYYFRGIEMNIITVDKAKEKLASLLTTPLPRKELLERCVKSQNLTQEELNDKTPGKTLNIIKCRFGDAIEQLIKNGTLIKNQNDELEFCKKNTDVEAEISRDIKIQTIILEILKDKKLTKKDLLSEICKALSIPLSLNESDLK
ncbi:MAG: hypothetical protein K2G42_03670, partial [Clostridia bacterium]|nr:hypothetical protein [Clostridia bacterium]